MATKNLTAPVRGPLTLSLRAGMAYVTVTASPGVRTATAEVTGPQSAVDGIRERKNGGTWEIALPDDGSDGTMIVSRGYGGGRTVIRGRVNSGVVIGGDSYGGTVIQAGGRVVVNGVDVTDVVNSRGGGDAGPVRVAVRLPAGSSAEADVGAGEIRVSGPVNHVTASTASADVSVAETQGLNARTASGDIRAGITGAATVRTASGDVTITCAHGDTGADTASGDIRVHCMAAIRVSARSAFGDIRVTAASGIRPRVRARSMSGHVVTPESDW